MPECNIYLHFISIHAPAKGATSFGFVHSSMHLYFNPRSRKGSDDAREGRAGMSRNFNPRSRKGSDYSAFCV